MKKKSLPFYLSISAIFVAIIAPNLFSDGMFMDGLIYATIARNMAVGIGGFWDLQFTETLFPSFHEHPPLAMGLQSIFFYIFGDSIYVERFYSLATFIVTAWLIVLIWRKSVDPALRQIAWLPLVFWTSIPLNIWAVSNNMLENTMMVFTSASVLFLMNGLEKKRLLFVGLAGFCIFLGFLSKGFTALFPLSFFFWVFVFGKISLKRFVLDSLLLLIFSILPGALVFLTSNEALKSITAYLNIQVLNSLTNVETVDSRFFIIIRLLKEMIPAVILFTVIALLLRLNFKKLFRNTKWNYSPFFFLALGLSGVIPIMVSMKQSGFYILASFPYFAVFFALLIAEPVSRWYYSISIQNKQYRIFKTASILLLFISIGFSSLQVNRTGRDKDLLSDVYKVSQVVPEGSTISILPEMATNWSLHAYFYRNSYISLNNNTAEQHSFLLVLKDAKAQKGEYQKIPLNLTRYELYSKEE